MKYNTEKFCPYRTREWSSASPRLPAGRGLPTGHSTSTATVTSQWPSFEYVLFSVHLRSIFILMNFLALDTASHPYRCHQKHTPKKQSHGNFTYPRKMSQALHKTTTLTSA